MGASPFGKFLLLLWTQTIPSTEKCLTSLRRFAPIPYVSPENKEDTEVRQLSAPKTARVRGAGDAGQKNRKQQQLKSILSTTMAKVKGAITVNIERCKGCNLCAVACPTNTLALQCAGMETAMQPVAHTQRPIPVTKYESATRRLIRSNNNQIVRHAQLQKQRPHIKPERTLFDKTLYSSIS